MKLIVSTLALVLVLAAANHPSFITDEEFAAVRWRSIQISNSSLQLPQYEERPQPRPGFGPNLWTSAIVPYTLDSNFNTQQRAEVALAFKAYHDNTCIRFVPKQSQHTTWVDILYDASTCGLAQLCMNRGGQWAKFGGSCATAGVMVHELGHTLCMGHEQSRLDRDDWISFNTSICQAHGKDGSSFNRGLNKLYDYVSIEHYEGECYNGCFIPKQPGVKKCGSGGPLSVLDIEILNEMYNCTAGCLGYRYVNSKNQLNKPFAIGNEPNGDILYGCRAYHNGDIVPGKYHLGRKECYVPYNGGEHVKTGNYVEVLTNPNNANFQWTRSGSRPANAIRGGRTSERETLYVIRCQLSYNGKNYWGPGKYQPSTGAYSSFGGSEVKCNVFDYLTCS